MPFDGSGNFNRALGPTTWQNDAAAGIKIKSDLHDNNDNDIANGLSQVICKDGQSSPTANISLNGHRLINVANPGNPQDAMTLNSFAAAAVRYDVGQALTVAQQTQAHVNLAATDSVLPKAAAYTLLQQDRGKLLRITAACTITLPAASAVTNDFMISFRTMGGAMTLAPNGTNQIEGVNANFVIPDASVGTLWCDGAAWWISNAGPIVRRLVTANETYTKPTGLKYLEVEGLGPGGASGGPPATVGGQAAGSSGAGAGAWGRRLFAASELAATTAVTIGAFGVGASGTVGTSGGQSSFGTPALFNCTLGGGAGTNRLAGITVSTPVTGGAGGTAGAGWQVKCDGENGAGSIVFWNATYSQPGAGGSCGLYGHSEPTRLVTGADAVPGTGYGAGGVGVCHSNAGSATAGTNGQPAMFLFTEYY